MRVEKKPKAFAYRIYSHFTQQCMFLRKVIVKLVLKKVCTSRVDCALYVLKFYFSSSSSLLLQLAWPCPAVCTVYVTASSATKISETCFLHGFIFFTF